MGKKLNDLLSERDQLQARLDALEGDKDLLRRIREAQQAAEEAEREERDAIRRFEEETNLVLREAGLSDGKRGDALALARNRVAKLAGLPSSSHVYQLLGTRYYGILERFVDTLRHQAQQAEASRLSVFEQAAKDAFAKMKAAKAAIPNEATIILHLSGQLRWVKSQIERETPQRAEAVKALTAKQLTEARRWLLKLEKGEVTVALPLRAEEGSR